MLFKVTFIGGNPGELIRERHQVVNSPSFDHETIKQALFEQYEIVWSISRIEYVNGE